MPAASVQTTVIDQSNRVNSSSTINAGIVIAAKKGEVNTPILVPSQTAFLRRFTPNEKIEIGWDGAIYEAFKYLETAGRLYVVRACSETAKFGGCLIKLVSSADVNISVGAGFASPDEYVFENEDDAILIYGANQGAWNNDISITITTDPKVVKLAQAFILKVYKKGVLVETHTCSLNPSLKNGYGVNCFIETVLEGSNYVRAISNALANDDGTYPLPKANEERVALKGGDDGDAVTDADRIRALKTLSNVNNIPLQIVMDGGNTTVAYHKAINDLCETRGDSCHGILSTRYEDEMNADKVGALKKYRNEELNLNTYNCELYTPHQRIYDEFNDRYLYVSPSCFVAALIAKYGESLGYHWAVAGYSRGIVDSIDVSTTFEPEEVDELSDNQINTIIKDPGFGNVIWDELTLQSTASDMQDGHISRYVNLYLRPKLKEALKPFLFEFNDETTRALIVKMLDIFMQPQKSARAVYDYKIVCDETNNTDSDIENNILNSWLYIKATKISKFIKQQIIVTPYSVELSDLG
jgi:hypothetical protein